MVKMAVHIVTAVLKCFSLVTVPHEVQEVEFHCRFKRLHTESRNICSNAARIRGEGGRGENTESEIRSNCTLQLGSCPLLVRPEHQERRKTPFVQLDGNEYGAIQTIPQHKD
jgi:hypothetical protein